MRLLPHVHRFYDDGDEGDMWSLYRCDCGANAYEKSDAIEMMHASNEWFMLALIAWGFVVGFAIVLIAKLWHLSW